MGVHVTTSELRKTAPPIDEATAPGATRLATRTEDAVTAVLATLLLGGAVTDAWAHTNIIKSLESFFTPWHGLLYGGFAATAAWTFWLAYRHGGGRPGWWRNGWPAGYALGGLGAAIFMVAGVGDMIWHTLLGIENGLDAALSPTHVGIAFGGTLLVTSPMRSWWAAGSPRERAASGIVSLALGTLFGTLLTEHASAFISNAPTHVYDHLNNSASHIETSLGLTRYLMSTVVIVVVVLLAHRRRATFGTTTAVVVALTLFLMTQFEFPRVLAVAAVGAVIGAVLADLALVRLDAVRGTDAPMRLSIAGAVIPALVWTGHLAGMRIADDLRWPIELWAGTVVLTALLGALLGGLATRPYYRT